MDFQYYIYDRLSHEVGWTVWCLLLPLSHILYSIIITLPVHTHSHVPQSGLLSSHCHSNRHLTAAIDHHSFFPPSLLLGKHRFLPRAPE